MSPFTLLFEKAGMTFAAELMNAVILTAIFQPEYQVCTSRHVCFIPCRKAIKRQIF